MSRPVITKEVVPFLNRLKKNNNREWFTEHKKEFKSIETDVKEFYNSLMEGMKAHDEIEKLKMFRIYRDVRFLRIKHLISRILRALSPVLVHDFVEGII